MSSLQCRRCGIDFGSQSEVFVEHVVAAHSDDSFACETCSDVFVGAAYALHVLDELSTPTSATSANADVAACPVCSQHFPAHLIEGHVNAHYDEKGSDDATVARLLADEEAAAADEVEASSFRALQSRYGMTNEGSYKSQGRGAIDHDYERRRIDAEEALRRRVRLDREHRVGFIAASWPLEGLVEMLRGASAADKSVTETRVSATTDFCGSDKADSGFGCGFRNAQMLLSSLMRCEQYRDKLWADGPVRIPSVPKLQELIERAWNRGFDSVGAAQLGGKLVGSRKWIGCTEVAALLHSFRIKVELVDFERAADARNNHPALFDWVWRYFAPAGGAYVPPLMLQHEGHSRTLVGAERTRAGATRLLLLDPSLRRERAAACLAERNCAPFRRTLSQLQQAKFQLLVVRGVMQTDQEHELSKVRYENSKVAPF